MSEPGKAVCCYQNCGNTAKLGEKYCSRCTKLYMRERASAEWHEENARLLMEAERYGNQYRISGCTSGGTLSASKAIEALTVLVGRLIERVKF